MGGGPTGPSVAEREAWAVLASVHGLGPATFGLLLREHGSARRVLELAASPAGRRAIRDGPAEDGGSDRDGWPVGRRRLAATLLEALGQAAADPAAALEAVRSSGVEVVTLDDPTYPGRLRGIEEPPVVLFVRGSVAALDPERAVAVVGTRRPTEAGRRIAARIADALARVEATTVSGLAVGIDGAAHAAAVAAGWPTIAVLGSGHGRLFPKAHRRLADAIVATGGVTVSELPPDASPTAGTFPRRNRVISGLAEATVVVEAATGSGALITARWALEQGRGCFLVPGPIDAPTSAGCLAFLREYAGEARIVAGLAELLDDLELVGASPVSTDRIARGPASIAATTALLGDAEAALARLLVAGVTTVDELAARSGLPVSTVLGTLTLLEIRGLVAGAYGRYRPAGVLAATVPGLP